jgi:hypothetical protein
MPIDTLTWKMLPVWSNADSSLITTGAGLISAIKSALEQSTYVDGSARVPGSGVAWTATTLADGSLKCTPVSNAHNMLVHFVAQAQTGASMPMAFGETRGTGGERVYATMALNPGAYSLATTATPWGSGASTRVFGYAIASPCYNTLTYGMNYSSVNTVSNIRIYESKDALLVMLGANLRYASNNGSVVTSVIPLMFGGFIAPLTSDASDAESDGLIYGMTTHGGIGPEGATYTSFAHSFYTNPGFLGHSSNILASGVAAGTKAGVFIPGTSSVRTFNISARFTAGLTTFSNKIVKMPIYIGNSTNIFGRVREAYVYKTGLVGTLLRSEGQDRGFIVGMSPTNMTDAVLLGV